MIHSAAQTVVVIAIVVAIALIAIGVVLWDRS